MNKLLLAAFAALALASCNSPESIAESRTNVEARLPEGCTVTYAGELQTRTRDLPVVVVICDGRRTTTTTATYRSGKVTRPVTTVEIDA